jgi:hypothetical protein
MRPWSAALIATAGIMLVGCQTCREPFRWGVNGHPYAQEGYRDVPVHTQLDLIAELGACWYRCDCSQSAIETNPSPYDALVKQAAAHGIQILPVIFPSARRSEALSLDQIRRASFKFARSLAQRYKKIRYWELDNELDNWAMVRKGETLRTG